MTKFTKIMTAFGAIGVGIIIGVVIMMVTSSEYINEQEARALVSERYQGNIDNVSLSDDDRFFIVSVEDGEQLYEITLDREVSDIEDIEVSENPDYVAEENDTPDEGSSSGEEQNEESGNEEDSGNEEQNGGNGNGDSSNNDNETASLISNEEARQIATDEIGGVYLQSTLNDDVSPQEYLVVHLVDDDDEGAIVSINANSGDVNRVIWVDLELEEIGDLEGFMQEVAQYNADNPYYHIEYDYEDGEYEEYDDFDDD